MFFCVERHKRIKLLIFTYFYELMDTSLVSDAKWDELAKSIDLSVDTGHKVMDKWFKKNFTPYTGQWIHNLPKKELKKLRQLISRLIEEGCFKNTPDVNRTE